MDLKNYMKKLVGSEEERAVSPVIGVILMVAITVILAAVIASFVMDIGDLGEATPTATFEWEQEGVGSSDPAVTVQHESGDSLDTDAITVSVEDPSGNSDQVDGSAWSSNEIAATDSLSMAEDSSSRSGVETLDSSVSIEEGTEFQVIWESSDGSQSQTLDTFTVN